MFRRSRHRVVTAAPLRAGDDLVISVLELGAGEDAISLLSALKDQFPGVRLHLLVGFGEGVVVKQHAERDSGHGGRDEPLPVAPEPLPRPLDSASPLGPKGDVVQLRYLSGSRVVAVYVPPEKQGNAVDDSHDKAPSMTHEEQRARDR